MDELFQERYRAKPRLIVGGHMFDHHQNMWGRIERHEGNLSALFKVLMAVMCQKLSHHPPARETRDH